jgi:amino acid adenylation domain-containing protein
MPMPYLLHHLLASSAGCEPDGPAVVDGRSMLTYAELETRSNRLAWLLRDLGVRRGDRVGMYLEKSLHSIVAIYGILKAGAAYVPFDPQAPAARLAFIARNCGIRVLITGIEKADRWDGIAKLAPGIGRMLVLNATEAELPAGPNDRFVAAKRLDEQPCECPAGAMTDADLGYILYTSGSTGDPKGVMLSHRNAMAFVRWAVDTFDVRSTDRLSSHAPLHFDLSVFDLFAAAMVGAPVVLVPPRTSVFPGEVVRFIEEERITVWYSVPSILTMMVLRGNLRPGRLPTLRTLLFAGEVFPTKYLRKLMALLPSVGFHNLYGPTETNVCTWYSVPALPPESDEPIPIGSAIANDEVFAVTDQGNLAGPGEVGELYVRGATVMRGYWGDLERTGRALLRHPFDSSATDLVYRTGDLVVQDGAGVFRLIGRRDAQIKSRGYRIELGEVEAALYAHPGVLECAVTAVPDELVTNRIKAYVVVREPLGEADLVRFCAIRLPRYMIPEAFEFRSALPKTSTGKVDRQLLAAAGV